VHEVLVQHEPQRVHLRLEVGLLLDEVVGFDHDGQEGVQQNEERDGHVRPKVQHGQKLLPAAEELWLVHGRVHAHAHLQDGLEGQGEGREAVHLLAKDEAPEEGVERPDRAEEQEEKRQVGRGLGDGPGHDPEARVEVDVLEDLERGREDDQRAHDRVVGLEGGGLLELGHELLEVGHFFGRFKVPKEAT